MPDELYDMWIKPEIASRGWPFSGDEAVVSDPSWAKYLRNHGPAFWRRVVWNRVIEDVERVVIEQRAKRITNQLACFAREFSETGFTPPALIPGTLPKILALANVTNARRQIPKPLVCLVQPTEWWLMDGHHRLSALWLVPQYESIPFDCWLGTHVL
ncbi:MAG: hypothetical protein ING36_15640 [Burkholderiales bacterium]|jgi:hypothetical protein|nr:hypothetical protein [Burkholderiales bacterium]